MKRKFRQIFFHIREFWGCDEQEKARRELLATVNLKAKQFEQANELIRKEIRKEKMQQAVLLEILFQQKGIDALGGRKLDGQKPQLVQSEMRPYCFEFNVGMFYWNIHMQN